MIDEQYWRDFACKFACKRGVTNQEILNDIAQDAMTKIYGMDLSRFTRQVEIERFVGRSVANMIRDWQKKERLRTHAQLYEFTEHLHSSDNVEDCFADYLDSIIPTKIYFYDGKYALVDTSDYDRIEHANWHVKNVGAKSYVRTWLNGKHQYLHRVIAGSVRKIPKGATVNFLNGNTLDCRRCNLSIGDIALL